MSKPESVGRGGLAGLLSRLFRRRPGGHCVMEKFGLTSRGCSEAGVALYRLFATRQSSGHWSTVDVGGYVDARV